MSSQLLSSQFIKVSFIDEIEKSTKDILINPKHISVIYDDGINVTVRISAVKFKLAMKLKELEELLEKHNF